MNRRNAVVISLFLALALVLGMAATLRTTQLGASAAPTVSVQQIAQRNRQLDAVEAKLRKAAARKPPALPAVPAAPSRVAAPAPAAQPPQVVYVRPKPIVKIVSRHGGEDGHEHDGHEGHDGGELDD